MRDFLDNEIMVGDDVVYCYYDNNVNANLQKGVVIGMTGLMVNVEVNHNGHKKIKRVAPFKLVVVTRNQIEMDICDMQHEIADDLYTTLLE